MAVAPSTLADLKPFLTATPTWQSLMLQWPLPRLQEARRALRSLVAPAHGLPVSVLDAANNLDTQLTLAIHELLTTHTSRTEIRYR